MAGARWGGPGQVNCYGVHAKGDSFVETTCDNRPSGRLDSASHRGETIFPAGQGREQVIQFHGILQDAIKNRRKRNAPGLKVALHLFEGYFGYFGEK